MDNMGGGEWHYTASYGWNRQSAVAIGKSLSSLVLPMPFWMRTLVVRCLLARTALHADAQGISGSCGPLTADAANPCPWSDVTDIVIWKHNYLKIIGIARRDDAAEYVTADEATATAVRTSRQSRRSRRKTHQRPQPRFPAIMAPDGVPYGAGNVLTTNGWCVNADLLVTAARRFAPHVQVVGLSGTLWHQPAPDFKPSTNPRDDWPFEYISSLVELIGWRRFLWALGVASSALVLILAGSHLEPALRAAHGAGTRGVWVAEQCAGSVGDCIWYGEFVLPDGTIVHSHVRYAGTVTPGYLGQTVPALDSGAGDEVYPVSGTDKWINDVLGLAAGGLALLLLIWRCLLARRRRWRSRHLATRLISDHDGATGSSRASLRPSRLVPTFAWVVWLSLRLCWRRNRVGPSAPACWRVRREERGGLRR